MTPGTVRLAEVTAGGVRWQVLPACQDQLFGPQGLRLDEWLRAGQAHVVKHGPHRTVYRVALPGLDFYLKHYRLPDLRAWLRQLIRPAKARMEFERALAVAARRVATVVPVALGEGRQGARPAESFLITHSLENAEALSTFLERIAPATAPGRQARLRQRLAVALGEFVARLHEAGVIHQDFHAANLLVRLEAGDRPSLHLIDLHAVRLRRPLSWAVSRENLVMLNRWFIVRASRSDRYRFWRAYCRVRRQLRGLWLAGGRPIPLPAWHCPPATDLARELEERTWQSNRRFWRHRDRRCLVENRYYRRLRSPGITGHAVRQLAAGELAPLLADPDHPFRRPGVALLKDSPSSTVAEFDLVVGGVCRRVIYKRFRVTRWSDPWAALVRTPPALRSWIYGHGLRERCLPTARPLAVFYRRWAGLWYEGYLITEKIPDAVDLHQFLKCLARESASERRGRLRQRLDQVARLVRDLHRRRLSHRDLKAGNILLTAEGVWLIDLVGVSAPRRLTRARCVQNLARLNASFHADASLTRADRLRFLRAYLQWGLFGRGGWKRWWREIAAATAAKIARNQRRGRPLA